AIIDELRALARGEQAEPEGTARDLAERCAQLNTTLETLAVEQGRQWERNSQRIQALMRLSDSTLKQLRKTTIDKGLLERQSEVLEQMVLSQECLSEWTRFASETLRRLGDAFPFSAFFVAFYESHSLGLHIFFPGTPTPLCREKARQYFTQQLLEELRLPDETPVDVDEHFLLSEPMSGELGDVRVVSSRLPQNLPRMNGLVGAAFGRLEYPDPQEEATIRALLAIMVMVVGSSRALANALEEIEYYAVRDPLSGLYNRRHFTEMLDHEIDRSLRLRHGFSIIVVDLDDFKEINDSYGQPTGDEVLRRISRMIKAHVRQSDMAARLGSDEFIALLPETLHDGARVVAQTLRETIGNTDFYTAEDELFHATVSVGVASYPSHGDSSHELLAAADEAIQEAKRIGKNEVGSPSQAETASGQRTRETRMQAEQLRTAIQERRVIPFYHSINDCHGGPLGYEVLARLRGEDGGTIPAARFIDTIERYGLARELDRQILGTALAYHQELREVGRDPGKLFFNLSPQEITNRDILGHAERLCMEHGVPPESVVFEILEREAIGDMSNMRRFLDELRDKGFAFALDDFGSGYNSFHYMRELHFDYVKIDGAFVSNILNSRVDHALVRNLVNLCRELGMQTVAEFVESEAILDALRAIGVDYVQGFHLSVPEPNID
ncbi:MAG: putative bifunctional diguanylate cyclase/phosphodiesterase, partial [Pseudomonadota bacterium]